MEQAFSRYQLAIEAARRGGDLAKRVYEETFHDRTLSFERKSDDSPVTVADRGAEELIRRSIAQHFPNDGFLGEEFGDQPGSSGYRWIIDPIDGTKSFIRHAPMWGTLIGLEYRGEPVAGVAYMPMFNHLYRALRGYGAYFNDTSIHVSKVATVEESFLCYSSLTWFQQSGKLDDFLKLYARTYRQRGYGDFYGFVLLAQGSCDIMIDYGVHPWDIAAVVPIVEEAGGRMTDWQDGRGIHKPDVVATNGKLHAEVLQYLRTS